MSPIWLNNTTGNALEFWKMITYSKQNVCLLLRLLSFVRVWSKLLPTWLLALNCAHIDGSSIRLDLTTQPAPHEGCLRAWGLADWWEPWGSCPFPLQSPHRWECVNIYLCWSVWGCTNNRCISASHVSACSSVCISVFWVVVSIKYFDDVINRK